MKSLAVLVAIAALGVVLAGSLGTMVVTAHQHDMADAFEIAFAD